MMLGKEELAKENLCIALDTENPERALKLWQATAFSASYSKVNRVYIQAANAGFPLIERLEEISPSRDGSVIVDLKWHDSPGTVHGYSKDVSRMHGVGMFTIHIPREDSGGEEMCHAALRGAEDATKEYGGRRVGESGIYTKKRPKVIGITELTTSTRPDYSEAVMRKAEQAVSWGLDGIVAAGKMARELQKGFGSELLYLFPGMEFEGIAGSEQVHTYSPKEITREFIDAGGDPGNFILIAGRAVTKLREGEANYVFVRKRTHGVVKEIASKL